MIGRASSYQRNNLCGRYRSEETARRGQGVPPVAIRLGSNQVPEAVALMVVVEGGFYRRSRWNERLEFVDCRIVGRPGRGRGAVGISAGGESRPVTDHRIR